MPSPRLPIALLLALATAGVRLAAQAPANATAKCKDGTYSTATNARGMCSRHGGVAEKLTPSSTATSSSTTTTTTNATGSVTTGGAAPAGATFECKDGTYSKAKTSKGACSTHGGIGEAVSAASPAPAPAAAAPSAAAPAAPRSYSKAPTVARPADAPATATAKCKDGTYSESKQHSGACSHHGGVTEWYQ